MGWLSWSDFWDRHLIHFGFVLGNYFGLENEGTEALRGILPGKRLANMFLRGAKSLSERFLRGPLGFRIFFGTLECLGVCSGTKVSKRLPKRGEKGSKRRAWTLILKKFQADPRKSRAEPNKSHAM